MQAVDTQGKKEVIKQVKTLQELLEVRLCAIIE